MPLAEGATFAGYTIVRMLGSGGGTAGRQPDHHGDHSRCARRSDRRRLLPGRQHRDHLATAPTDEPLPLAEENPVRVCMQQTGQTRRECRQAIRESNGLPPLP